MEKKRTSTKTEIEASFIEAAKDVCEDQGEKELASAKKQRVRANSNRHAAELLKDKIAAYERLPEVNYQPVPKTQHFSGMPQALYDMIFDELAHGHAPEDISENLGGISFYCIEIASRRGGFRVHGQFGPLNRSQRIFLERDMMGHPDVDYICRNWGLRHQTVSKYAKEFGVNMIHSSNSQKGQAQRQREKWHDSSDLIVRPPRGAPYVPKKARRKLEAEAQANLWDIVREKNPAPIRTSKNNDVTPKIDDKKPKTKDKTKSGPKTPASSKTEVTPEPC